MTGSEGHRARMGSDTPRGYGVRETGGLTDEEWEPDPYADIAEMIGSVHGCDDPRSCTECRETAGVIWRSSPGHREMWFNQQQNRLAEAIKDVCWRAQQYGQTDDGDVFAYLVTKGAMHRLIGAAQCAGISASFRADASDTPPDIAAREGGHATTLARVEALLPGFEADYGINSSPVTRLRAALRSTAAPANPDSQEWPGSLQ